MPGPWPENPVKPIGIEISTPATAEVKVIVRLSTSPCEMSRQRLVKSGVRNPAEEREEADPRQIEAIRATGASWLQLIHYAVQPQVMPRMIGMSVYRLDINFRESAVIGIVGAGGIGGTLDTALSRYEYSSAGAILLIIAIVMLSEYASSRMRGWLK